MQAQEIINTDPVCVMPDTLIYEAARLMKDQNIDFIPVVDGDGSGTLVGVITDRDITVQHVAAGHPGTACQVWEAMTEGVATCRPDADMKDLMQVMEREQVRQIFVVDERNSLIGVVSQADISLLASDTKVAWG